MQLFQNIKQIEGGPFEDNEKVSKRRLTKPKKIETWESRPVLRKHEKLLAEAVTRTH